MGISKPSQGCVKHQKDMAVLYFVLYFVVLYFVIVIHFMIGFIHPFLDGNGRTARALFYWYAIKSGYDNFQYISISALLKSKPKKYARAYIYTETDELDLTHFIDFNLGIIIEALERFKKYIEEKTNELNKTIEELHKSPYYQSFTLAHIEIIKKALKSAGRSFTAREISSNFNVSAPAARNYLNSLADSGLLIKYNIKGRLNGYIAPADLRARLKINN
ncbi:Fic family protein [Shewanella algae]|uniref:Fic family protein n=1 Tax=Shewanella algae TaxID=38313 RepID=UPI001AACAEA1|nr:Fic family protein [Shewanella algae]MBO2569130.1 Fic family protein [Shewanella algae]